MDGSSEAGDGEGACDAFYASLQKNLDKESEGLESSQAALNDQVS